MGKFILHEPAPLRRFTGDEVATRIVGLGASAGGLQPLEEFLAHVPVPSGLAYVVVQHLDPTHKTMLSELLQRATSMPVREVTGSMRVEPDAVYVIPPNTELTVNAGFLRLSEPREPRGMRLPIDVLFCSLAGDQGASAIGVVFSGMGSDGTLGLQAIRSQGGLTLAQEPHSAQFDSMPKSAIAAGAADVVGLASELPARILHVTDARRAPGADGETADGTSPALASILELLGTRGKHDLTLYKPSTLRRRIERRMAIHRVRSMADYAGVLRANPTELDLLFKEILIGVTSFFRDPEAWEELGASVLPELLARSPPDRPFRAWVVGCSTGEEAYSLAMRVIETRERLGIPAGASWQIFATDLNADAIALARRGRYPGSITAQVSASRLQRFFRAQDDGYVIDPRIRERVLFAQHDVIMDPPFTRLDLLSCRNLLIYFNAVLQKRLLPLFHYSLRPRGILLLGASETVGAAQNLFPPLSSKSRLYERSSAAAAVGAVDFPIGRRVSVSARAPAKELNVSPQTPAIPNLQALADEWLLQKFSPAAVLVNELGDVLYISGHAGQYLEPAAGKANWNIHVMARPAFRAQLAVALRRAVKERTRIEVPGLRLDGKATQLDITVEAIEEPKALGGLVMVVFREVVAPLAGKSRRKKHAGAADPEIAAELMRCQEELKSLREAMRASEEERQAAIEELQSTNEELQSANEELTTSKEESQSMNEELQTINVELQSKLDDLALAQSDMQNLLNSTDIATLFLDKDLNVRRFTEQMKRIVNLRDADVGRPLSDLTTTLNYSELAADARDTLRTLAFSEKEISTSDSRWFKVRIMPYRTVANVIQGAVITFVDITAAKQLESRLRNS
jgi:two-component system CheB/CheR fusion protein